MGTIATTEVELGGHKVIVTLFTHNLKGNLVVKARARMKRKVRIPYNSLLEFYNKYCSNKI